MKRLLMFLSAACLLAASTANAVSTYKKTSYTDGGVVLRASAAKGSILNPGEQISFTYQTSEDAFVVLFNIDTEGYVHLLYPYDTAPEMAQARRTYRVPAGQDKLLVSGETGMEFVFAVTVPFRGALDDEELAYLRDVESRPIEDRYRIDGDPFLAANIIAGELVRGVSHRNGVFLDYTYFYVNQRVDYPCYLCGDCAGQAASGMCDQYDLVANFDRSFPLTYPLQRAYDAVERGTPAGGSDVQLTRQETVGDDDVNVSFYPYSVEVRYVTRPRVYANDWGWYGSYWYDPFWDDPWSCGWVYYPGWSYPWYGHYSGWSFGWGYWGGYYCSNWYWPRYHHWRDYYYNDYWDYAGYNRAKYKTAYKERSNSLYRDNALVSVRERSVKRNPSLRIASRNLKTPPRTISVAKDTHLRTPVRGLGPATTRKAIGRTRVTTRAGKSLSGISRTRTVSPRVKSGVRRPIRSTYEPRSRSNSTRPRATVKPRSSTRRQTPRVKSRSGSSSRSRSSVKSRPRRSSSSSNSRATTRSRSTSRAKSSSRSSSRSSGKSRSGSKGKRK